MKKWSFWDWFFLILIILIVAFAIFFLTRIFGTGNEAIEQLDYKIPKSEITFEATIVSLFLEGPEMYTEGGEIYKLPEDSAMVRIDKVISIGGDYDFNWSSIGMEEGEEISLDFEYGLRPAKIITVPGKEEVIGNAVLYTPTPTTVAFEDGYFVMIHNGNTATEIFISGLEEGDKFRATIYELKMGVDFFGSGVVKIYEVLERM